MTFFTQLDALTRQKRVVRGSADELERSVKSSFVKVKEELDEHLEAINDNTTEIQSSYEHLIELEAKVDKLNEKMEQILMHLEGKKESVEERFVVQPLTLREQEVFAQLYLLDSHNYLSYLDISHRIGLPIDMIKALVQTMTNKGVHVMKRYVDDILVLQLDPEFRQYQAKTNALQINEAMYKQPINN